MTEIISTPCLFDPRYLCPMICINYEESLEMIKSLGGDPIKTANYIKYLSLRDQAEVIKTRGELTQGNPDAAAQCFQWRSTE